jgi:hypothetical protein
VEKKQIDKEASVSRRNDGCRVWRLWNMMKSAIVVPGIQIKLSLRITARVVTASLLGQPNIDSGKGFATN